MIVEVNCIVSLRMTWAGTFESSVDSLQDEMI